MDHIYIYIYINTHTYLQLLFIYTRLLAIKKNEILRMDPHGIMLNEISKTRQLPYNFTYIWNIKNETETESQREQTGDCQS